MGIVLLIVLVALFALAINWGGKCKSCGSWNTWKDEQTSTDHHRPGGYYRKTVQSCRACKEVTELAYRFVYSGELLDEDE